MAWGLPVIGTPQAFTGLPQLDGRAFVVDPLDPLRVANRIAVLRDDPELRLHLGLAARQWVAAHHSPEAGDGAGRRPLRRGSGGRRRRRGRSARARPARGARGRTPARDRARPDRRAHARLRRDRQRDLRARAPRRPGAAGPAGARRRLRPRRRRRRAPARGAPQPLRRRPPHGRARRRRPASTARTSSTPPTRRRSRPARRRWSPSTTSPFCGTRSGSRCATARCSTPACARPSSERRACSCPRGTRATSSARSSASPPERVLVTPEGVDDRFAPANGSAARARRDTDALFRRLGIRRPYVLALGNLQPRKNLARLVEAWALLVGSGADAGHRLVVAGGFRGRRDGAPARAISLGIGDRVVFPGRIRADGPADAVRRRERLRLPVAVRGLRPPRAGGHGLRHAGRLLARRLAAGGRRRRRRPVRPSGPAGHRRRRRRADRRPRACAPTSRSAACAAPPAPPGAPAPS